MPAPVGLPILTERLVIRPYEPADAVAFTAIRNDPEVARYQSWSVPFPLERAAQNIDEFAAMSGPMPGEWYQLAVCDRSSGTLIGDLPVHVHDSFPTAEIGYSFARAWQGRGLATEAVGALIGWLFGEHQLRRLEAFLHPDNLPSARLLERLGFLYEGTKRLAFGPDSDPSDDPGYGLLRTEWPAWNDRPRQPPDQVRLVEITPYNLDAVLAVTIHRSQERHVTPLPAALVEVIVPPVVDGAPIVPWHRGVEADGEIVGFVLISLATPHQPMPVVRTLLVDRRHQGRGIRARVVELISEQPPA